MDAGRSLRELFAELSRPGAGDPADLLHAAGYGDVPGHLVAEAIVSYAATAPVEVAEHLAPFVVAHGPVPTDEPGDDAAGTAQGLSLLASAPVVEVPAVDHVPPDPDPSVGDAPGLLGAEVDVDPAGVDGLDHGDHHAGAGPEPHAVLGSFGVGHGPHAHGRADDGRADHDVDSSPVHDHDHHLDPDDPGVSHLDATEADGGALPPSVHDTDTDPADLLDGDEHDHHL